MGCFPFQLTTVDINNEFGVEDIKNVTDLKKAVSNQFTAGAFYQAFDEDQFTSANVIVLQVNNYDTTNPAVFKHPNNWKTIDAFKQDFAEYPFIIVTSEEHQKSVQQRTARDAFYVFFPLQNQMSKDELIEFSTDLQNAYKVSGVSYFSFFNDVDYPCESTSNPIVEVNDGPGDLLSDIHSNKIEKTLPLIQYFNESIFPQLDFDKVYQTTDIVREDQNHFFCNCPFHEDQQASFMIDKKNLNWECTYGCGKGNPSSFIQRRHILIYRDAIELLSRRADVSKKTPIVTLTISETFEQLWEINPNLNIYPINGELHHAAGAKIKRVANFDIRLLYRMKSGNPFDTSTDYMVKITTQNKNPSNHLIGDKDIATNDKFKARLLSSAGLVWSGKPTALDALKEYLLQTDPPEIRKIDQIGYDEKSDCYMLGDVLFDSQGKLVNADSDGLFLKEKLCLDEVTVNRAKPITEFEDIDMKRFLDELYGAFSAKGILVFSFFVSSLFGRQIINRKRFFPFMSLWGDPHSGKTTLTDILTRCFFLDWTGIHLSKSNTQKGLIREFGIRKNFVIALTEGNKKTARILNEGVLLDMYEWKPVATAAQLGSRNKTNTYQYEGSFLFVQNEEWFETVQLIERIFSLHFTTRDNSDESYENLQKLLSYSNKQLASIGKQILERRSQIEPELIDGIKIIAELLKEKGCGEPRFIDNSSIVLGGFLAVLKVFDFKEKTKINLMSVFEEATEITKLKEDLSRGNVGNITANLFFENCYELLDEVDIITGNPDPKLIKGEQYIIEDGLLYLRITATIDKLKKYKMQRPTPPKLTDVLMDYPAYSHRMAKRSPLWTHKKLKPGERHPKPHCVVLFLDKLGEIGEKFENPGKNYSVVPIAPKTSHAGTSTPNFQPAKSSNNINYTGAPPAIAEMLAREADIQTEVETPVTTKNKPSQPQTSSTQPAQVKGGNQFPVLFRRTSVGETQQWKIEVQDNKFRTIHGQKDGKQTTTNWTECTEKNVGKSNKTTAEVQALKEAKAKYEKQQKKGYRQDISEIDKLTFIKPMLARKYEDHFDGKFKHLFSQPKLDGMRCLVSKDGMFTRQGNKIVSAPHVFSALHHLFNEYPDIIFDGELFADKLKDNFNKIISLAKKLKPTEADIAESAKHLQYWVYDVISGDPFITRFDKLSAILKGIQGIVITPTKQVQNRDELDELFQDYLNDGMEGQMVRNGAAKYEHKRSDSLLKRKSEEEEEFTIVSLHEGKGNYSGMIKTMTLKTDEGIEFDATIKGEQKYLKSLMKNPAQHIGSEATVIYQNLTPDGKPRFARVKTIWDGKRNV
jgi:DNA ligase 1